MPVSSSLSSLEVVTDAIHGALSSKLFTPLTALEYRLYRLHLVPWEPLELGRTMSKLHAIATRRQLGHAIFPCIAVWLSIHGCKHDA